MPPRRLMGCVVGPQSYCQECGAEQREGKGSFLQRLIPRKLLSAWLSPTPESAPRPNLLLISGLAGAQAMDSQIDIPCSSGVSSSVGAGVLGPHASSCQPRVWVRALPVLRERIGPECDVSSGFPFEV